MVTGRVNPNLDLDLITCADDTLHLLDKLRQTRTIQREHERRDEPFTGRVGDKSHRHKLADIHRDQQTPLRREPTDPDHALRDITTMNMHHDNTSGVFRDG